MVFSSIIFLFYFLPIVLVCYYISPKKWKNAVFLLASLFYCAWGRPRNALLLLFSIVMNYAFGRIVASPKRPGRKLWLAAAVLCNLGFLGVFKYTNFVLDNMGALLGLPLSIPAVTLPVGISFYTFQALSYVIDIYRGQAAPQTRITHTAVYIASFPQLASGPIARYSAMAGQLVQREHSAAQFSAGVSRFIAGLSKKVLLSNPLGAAADEMFRLTGIGLSTASAWLGILCYTLQIYFDFSGYSDMAIGIGKMFGFSLNENFDYPYICKSVKEFWRRWHISLSTWFRDYVYIPLGGNRCAQGRQVLNLLAVWLLTGIWHGAAWTFIFWGVYYGLILLLERYLEPLRARLPGPLQHAYAMLVVMVGWVFFRSDSMQAAGGFLRAMFGFSAVGAVDATARLYLHDNLPLLAAAVLLSTPAMKRLYQWLCSRWGQAAELPVRVLGGMALLALCVLYLANVTYSPFIYFKF